MAQEASVTDILQLVARAVAPIGVSERVPLDQALGRFLAEDVLSPMPVPRFNNSAMDGFAFAAEELAKPDREGKHSLRIVGASYAGSPFDGAVGAGEGIRVMTGAQVPAGLDTVIPFEKADFDEAAGVLTFAAGAVKPGANVRLRGEEIEEGAAAIRSGEKLSPAHIGLAASLGAGELLCRRIRVTIFATGDELAEPGTALKAGGIYNSNSHLLAALCRRWGCDVCDLGILPDDTDAQRRALAEAAAKTDFLITSGGVGEGDKDLTTAVLAELADMTHYHIRMRPGKPFSFGALKGRSGWCMALPGNPVAAAMSAWLFLREAVWRAAGAESAPIERLSAFAGDKVRGRAGRTDFVRGTVRTEDGRLVFRPAASQSSAMLTTLAGMNAAAVLEENEESAPAGSEVTVLRLTLD